MTSEIEAVPSCIMKLVERSYTTPPGWRLATVQEARDNLEMIKQQEWDCEWERARLLDGWIIGPRYDFQIGDDFRIFLGHMLVIQIQGDSHDLRRSIYAGVTLTDIGREVALLLCAHDWNYEVLYWLLNSWEKRDPLDLSDVREGKIPFGNTARFVQMNRMICHLSSVLGEEGIAAQIAAERIPSVDLVREVMVSLGKSCWDKLRPESQKILPRKAFLQQIDYYTKNTIISRCLEANWFEDFVSQRDTSDFVSQRDTSQMDTSDFFSQMDTSDFFSQRDTSDFVSQMDTSDFFSQMDTSDFFSKMDTSDFFSETDPDDIGNFVSQRDTLDAIWNFFWHFISSRILLTIQCTSFSLLMEDLKSEEHQAGSRGNFFVSTAILYYLLDYEGNVLDRILRQACKVAVGDDRQHFKDMLENTSSSYCDETGNYHILNKILIYAKRGDNSFLVSKLLEWGVQPQASLDSYLVDDSRHKIRDNEKENLRSLFDNCELKEYLANVSDDGGWTALHWACRYADVSIVEMILQYGGKLDVRDKGGRLPLHYAVKNGKKEIVISIFDKCDSEEQFANAGDDEGWTALHLACCHADASIVEMILKYGGNPGVPDKIGRVPLHYAVEYEKEDIVNVMTGRGKSDTVKDNDEMVTWKDFDEMVTWKDNDGMSPLDLAAKKKNIKLLVKLLSVYKQSLLSYFDKADSAVLLREFSWDGRCRTALHYASMLEDGSKALQLSKLMLTKCTSEEEKKIWVQRKDNCGETALHVAAIKGHKLLCQYFCFYYRDILNVKDANGRCLIYEVVDKSHHDNPDVIMALLKFWDGEVQSTIDHTNQTLLHVAASAGKMFIADFLIERSREAKVRYLRTPDILGQTALHKAAKGGHVDTVTVLLHHGAHPLLERDSDGRTALHCAVQKEAEDRAKEAKDQTKEAKDRAKEAEARAIAVAELVLKKCGSDEKKLLLLWASAAGLGTADQQLSDNSPLKKFLLAKKRYINEKLDTEGKKNNLLRIAACLGDIAMTKELLTRGAQVGDIRDQEWKNSLNQKERHNVDTVCKQIQIIAEQGNDQPATSDNLGRSDFAYGLAALLLNPYLKPPITVGISGSWDRGHFVEDSCTTSTTAI
ncbi:uncharacterized protein LOC131859143 [Cryptomeria japonica]|uniref:uncharacterized protein LOC131859143 n=1 Tax=Cryptomeria japonica TaxID=3369 RepID=UPI0027D9D68D|nr:uncharacterized protein LOC131859143 [Cryptomeria japonica]